MTVIGNFRHSAEELRTYSESHKEADAFTGQMLAAGESFSRDWTTVAAGSELYKYGRKGEMTPLLIGCITYQILQDTNVHQTAFAYYFERVGGR